MASTDWPAWTTTNATYTYSMPLVVTTGSSGGGGYAAPAPTPKTALDWLDDEVEAVCKLARLS